MRTIVTKKEIETFNLGLKLAKKLKGGEVLALVGDLGAGKTKLIQGLAKGLGVKVKVNSPTFNILKIYQVETQHPGLNKLSRAVKVFCHIDAYRLRSEKDLISLGAPELFNQPEVVTAIEWAEKVEKIWPKKTVVIRIKHLNEKQREIIIR
jgi:tRNA threonylcarbamoyladenosine biosynthesis protein TsaE